MSKRFTDTDLWDKEWYMALSCKHKCLIRFLFDKCDAAGVWSPNWLLASAYIGEQVSEDDLKIFGDRIEKLDDGKFFLTGFIEFQYGTLSEECRPHIKIIALLKKYDLYDRVCKGYTKGIYTLEDMDKDKEEEEDKEKDKDKDKGDARGKKPKSSIDDLEKLLVCVPDNWKEMILFWLQYKWKKGNKYKDEKSVKLFYEKLFKFSEGDQSKAMLILQQSMENNWQGIFELKGNYGKQSGEEQGSMGFGNRTNGQNSFRTDAERRRYEREGFAQLCETILQQP